jgi:NAD(P)-dependent dehydrogenase (short-subunit alcohol dehydrogenase family)
MSKVLITGTNSGIGFETAIVLGRGGHTVYATMRNPERGAALREVVEKEQLPISIVTMDVDSDESVEAATSTIRARTGCIDVLVNNAGIERTGSIEGLALDDFKATMETNYFGALRSIRAWLADMRKRQSGCIINVSSVAGRIACSPLTPYSASKFALEALSEALAQEVKPFNVRVAIVQPGIIDTAMARRIEDAPTDAAFPQVRRFGHMFEASLDKPTPPTIVAEKIREIIESGTQKLRHPVGPDAEAFLGWRASLTDEEWVEWGALPDEAWYERVGKDFGLDARSKRRTATGASASSIRARA